MRNERGRNGLRPYSGRGFDPDPTAADAEQTRAQQAAPLQGLRAAHVAPGALGVIVRSFKARVTRDVRAVLGFDVVVWQRNYHEHVIRHEAALLRIQQYIVDNPARWEFDLENPSGRPDRVEHEFAAWLDRKLVSALDPEAGAAR